MPLEYDVAIVGGGPAGSTAGTLIKKHNPDLSVLICEKEKFPREHIGESQLPYISRILQEMGCWDKVEAANFPIKVGGTYRWGQSDELWDFDFVPHGEFEPIPRPNKYEGQRIWTAWHVDRSIYDKILLDHASELGCDVREECAVTKTVIDPDNPDRIDHIEIRSADGATEQVRAKHYLDASGRPGVLRRALPVKVEYPSSLMNVAFWNYWDNAEWAVELGIGGTRVQVLSIGSGWVWFIPLGPTKASVGFVCPKTFYKETGKSPKELYDWALSQEPRVSELLRNATPLGEVDGTTDWSFTTDRLAGDNWFLMGEAAGFADPILAGGLMLTHSSARHAAYVVLELERGDHDPQWMREEYTDTELRRVGQHIRFAEYWYAGNGQFTDLQEFSSKLASDAGLNMNAEEAFRWLSNGGFADDYLGGVGIGGQDIGAVKQLTAFFGKRDEVAWEISKYNHFELNLDGADEVYDAALQSGRIYRSKCFVRDDRRLPTFGLWGDLLQTLQITSDLFTLHTHLKDVLIKRYGPSVGSFHADHAMQMLEVMVDDGWVRPSLDKARPTGKHFKSSAMGGNFGFNQDQLTKRMSDKTAPAEN